MEQTEQYAALLALIERPAFIVHDGKILLANRPALQRQIAPQTEISLLWQKDTPIPELPKDSCLYLPLTISGVSCGASVQQVGSGQVYVLEEEQDSQLQALALASQQLRGPLSGMMSAVAQLAEEEAQSAQMQEQMAHIQQKLYRLLRIVSNMSDAYRYNLDGNAHMATVNITSLFQEILENARQMTESTTHTLQHTQPRQAIFCLADREILERAIYNLISNAFKFSADGSTITASLTQQGNTLYLCVRDNGGGSHIRGNLFSRYLRQPGIEDSRYGLGLGLVLARTAALLHGGTLLIEQPENQGTSVTMAIPIRQDNRNAVRTPILTVDYSGEHPHGLMELSDILPASFFRETF